MRSKGWVVGTWMWIVYAVIATGCSGCASRSRTNSEPKQPDVTGIMRLVGKYSIASGCPVGPRKVITNAHVIDPRPFDRDVKLTPMKFQHGQRVGILLPVSVDAHRDLGEMLLEQNEPDLAMYYEVAAQEPRAGDAIYFSGYNWQSKRDAFAERMFAATVLRVVAGIIVFDPAGEPGTSGSCVLNSEGKVVGINAFGKSVGFIGRDEVGGAILYTKSFEAQ